jgi:hypothetical protein
MSAPGPGGVDHQLSDDGRVSVGDQGPSPTATAAAEAAGGAAAYTPKTDADVWLDLVSPWCDRPSPWIYWESTSRNLIGHHGTPVSVLLSMKLAPPSGVDSDGVSKPAAVPSPILPAALSPVDVAEATALERATHLRHRTVSVSMDTFYLKLWGDEGAHLAVLSVPAPLRFESGGCRRPSNHHLFPVTAFPPPAPRMHVHERLCCWPHTHRRHAPVATQSKLCIPPPLPPPCHRSLPRADSLLTGNGYSFMKLSVHTIGKILSTFGRSKTGAFAVDPAWAELAMANVGLELEQRHYAGDTDGERALIVREGSLVGACWGSCVRVFVCWLLVLVLHAWDAGRW